MSDRTPELAILLVLALLVAGALLLGGEDGGEEAGADGGAAVSAERLERVERRVEELRGLRFKRPVRVEVLSPEEVRRVGERETAESTSEEETAEREELLKLLGLIDADVDMDEVTSAVYGEQVAGFYDPRSERLALVEGVGVDDVTLAHELTHALEDQHFDLERFGDPGEGDRADDDRASAESGLVEGTATLLMTRYLEKHPDAISFGEALGQLWNATGGTPLPDYLRRSLLFSYEQGERFVSALADYSGDWRLVDNALRHRPPVSTAELYDARRWLSVRRPARVSLPDARELGAGWERRLSSTFGEYDLRELLRGGVGDEVAGRLAGGWEGGRYAFWRHGPLPAGDCTAPCGGRDAFTLALRFDTRAAAGAAGAALGAWLVRDRGATRAGDGSWRLLTVGASTGAAIATRGDRVTLVLTPSVPLAERIVR